MKCRKIFVMASLTVLGLAFLAAPSARTQGPAAVRVVRLSRADGQVLVSHSGSNAFEAAPANLPLQEGDSLATQSGFAEIEFENGATAYLAENSILQFTRLGFAGGGHATELTLTQGAGTFNANLTGQDTFVVHTLTFDVVATPEHAEFRIDGFRDGAAVEVTLGSVHVSTTKGSTDLAKGHGVAVHQGDFDTKPAVGMLPSAEDAFDQLVTEEGERIRSGNKNTASYLNSPNSFGLSDLAIYGNWVNLPVYGFTWRPFSVGLTWTPYLNGRWILDPRLGWIWVSNEPWGWMPYHYGSWLLSPAFGWLWVPGGPGGLSQWESARVNWVQLGNQVGWLAKSPEDRDGAPANLKKGVITLPVRPSAIGNEPNKILSGKELLGVVPIKQPPPEFASSSAHGKPGATPSGIGASDGANAGNTAVASAALMPERNGQNNSPAEIPRVTIPPTGPVNARVNRLFMPGIYSSREVFPASAATSIVPPSYGPASNFRLVRPPVAAPNTPIAPGVPSQATRPAASQPQAQHPAAAKPVHPRAAAPAQPAHP
jgi:hypothetical protein